MRKRLILNTTDGISDNNKLLREYQEAVLAWSKVRGDIEPRDPEAEEIDEYLKRVISSFTSEQRAAYIRMESLAAQLISGPGGP